MHIDRACNATILSTAHVGCEIAGYGLLHTRRDVSSDWGKKGKKEKTIWQVKKVIINVTAVIR